MRSISIDTVVIHPVFDRAFFVTEHPDGELESLGDALGCDCIVARLEQGWRWHDGDGSVNEDWYSWGVAVLAPFSGTVEAVHHPTGTNRPRHPVHESPGRILFHRDDGVRVLFGHVDRIAVSIGDSVTAGQPVAVVGNNGYSWYPHLHVGAWRDVQPLQIRFDLQVLGNLRMADPNRYYGTIR